MPRRFIDDARSPRATLPTWQHALDTYASETNKIADVWQRFTDGDLEYRPHDRSSTVGEILKHQLLSERRFFGEFLGLPEPAPAIVVPQTLTVGSATDRLVELAANRLASLADAEDRWWLERVRFFDVERQRIWIFWRRVLHSAHHRTQLTVYLRLLGRPVPAVYGPSADERWEGADPTHSVDAAAR